MYQWRYILPGVAAPVGGGLIKIGQGSTWAAVSVSLAPYVVDAIVCLLTLTHTSTRRQPPCRPSGSES